MRKADNLPPSCAIVTRSGSLNFLEPYGPVQACNGTALPFFISTKISLSHYAILTHVHRTPKYNIFHTFLYFYLDNETFNSAPLLSARYSTLPGLQNPPFTVHIPRSCLPAAIRAVSSTTLSDLHTFHPTSQSLSSAECP